MNTLALDIGGANLKLAHSKGFTTHWPFPLWKRHEELADTLTRLLATAPAADQLAVTMTGELADCFSTKAEGVTAILDAVKMAAGAIDIVVYLCDGRLVSVSQACQQPLLAAASNWHVLGSYTARFTKEHSALLLDLGSTTCDIIPLANGSIQTVGLTDPERLASSELVYTGVERSPVCAVVRRLPWRGEPCQVAQEVFATTVDAYLILEDLPADDNDLHTADGRPRTKAFAQARLARTVCADSSLFSSADAQHAALAIREAQLEHLQAAVETVLRTMETSPQTILLSGRGEFLLRKLVDLLDFKPNIVSLADRLGPEVSNSACAYALAQIALERSVL